MSATWQRVSALCCCANTAPANPDDGTAFAHDWLGAVNVGSASLSVIGTPTAVEMRIPGDGLECFSEIDLSLVAEDEEVAHGAQSLLPPDARQGATEQGTKGKRVSGGSIPNQNVPGMRTSDQLLADRICQKDVDGYSSDQMIELVSEIDMSISEPGARRTALSHVVLHMKGRQYQDYEDFSLRKETSSVRRYACADIIERVLQVVPTSTEADRELFCKVANLGFHGAHTCLKVDDPERMFFALLNKIEALPDLLRSSEDFGQLLTGYRDRANRPTRLLSQLCKLAVEIYGQRGASAGMQALDQLFLAADILPLEQKLAFYCRIAGYANFFKERKCDLHSEPADTYAGVFDHIFYAVRATFDVADTARIRDVLQDKCGWMTVEERNHANDLMFESI